MIVDDEKHVREGLLLLAEWERFGIKTVIEAADGEEAMKLVAKERPQIIFTDMRMPKKDGVALLQWLYTSNWKTKTIVVSGYDDFRYLKETITYQGFDYLLKPINPTDLNKTLQRAVTAGMSNMAVNGRRSLMNQFIKRNQISLKQLLIICEKITKKN